MSAINTQKQLLDTIELLERRVQRHEDVLHSIKAFVKKYKDNGKANKELSDLAKYVESLIGGAYK